MHVHQLQDLSLSFGGTHTERNGYEITFPNHSDSQLLCFIGLQMLSDPKRRVTLADRMTYMWMVEKRPMVQAT